MCSFSGKGKIFFPSPKCVDQLCTLSSLQLVPGAFSSGLKQPEHEYDYSSPSSAQVNEWSYTSVLPMWPRTTLALL